MKIAHPSASRQTGFTRICGIGLLLVLLLNGCALPSPTPRAAIYDFGPGPLSTVPNSDNARLPTLVIEMVNANPALDSTAMLYRLAYSDSQQLRPYSLARWSMTPTQLLRQRLRDHLGQRYALLTPDDDGQSAGTRAPARQQPLILRIELEEFSQLFSTPETSVGLLRLRATVAQGGGAVAQRSVIIQHSAPSPDTQGGVRALTAATDTAAQELDQWLQEFGRP
jgi:cholesterol transport system auxiliary component